jgi:hypothetical protein
MTPADLRALLAAATPGEWAQHQYQILQRKDMETEIAVVADTVDCSLIVAAINALPALLDRLELVAGIAEELMSLCERNLATAFPIVVKAHRRDLTAALDLELLTL